MLAHTSPAVRALGCQVIALHRDTRWLRALLRRASDQHFAVRAAAFDALQQLHPLDERVPARDTPMAQRERWLSRWLVSYAAVDEAAPKNLFDVCERYADLTHVLLDEPIVSQCFSCHAPHTLAQRPVASETCGQCHPHIYNHWRTSAHAQSITHLRHLRTINPQTLQPDYYPLGDRRGIACIDCHVLSNATPVDGSEGACRYAHRQHAGSSSCQPCHATTWQQWKTWAAAPRLARVTWPPGEIAETAGPAQTCTDCHMPQATQAIPLDETEPGAAPYRKIKVTGHRWQARRDPSFLRDGLHVQLQVESDRPDSARLTITNLTGHAFPTGTARRAMRLTVVRDGGPPEQLSLWATSMQPDASIHPPLAPGEVRDITVPRRNATDLTVRLTYIRDRFREGSYETEIASMDLRMD